MKRIIETGTLLIALLLMSAVNSIPCVVIGLLLLAVGVAEIAVWEWADDDDIW